jgi:uncharacterized spore protein YtfJ
MESQPSNTMQDARHAAESGPTERFLASLADRIGARAGVETVFGEPIQRGELAVVPVARMRWFFGGGYGSGGDQARGGGTGSGSGGGGGVAADPVGHLEIRPSGATFVPIVLPYPSPLFLLASGVAAALMLRALARLVRG